MARVPNVNRQQTNPLPWNKSRRMVPIEVGTSLPAGKVVPVWATHLLRQDNLRAQINYNIEMQETNELLANAVQARVSAYLVPWLAFDRFEKSRDQFDRSYMGEPQVEGGAVVPFFNFEAMGAAGVDEIYKYLGFHAKEGDNVETSYAEAYNLIHNFRLRNRSRDLTLRTSTDKSLAQALWDLGRFRHILPDFDQAIMEGEVALNVVEANMPVKGIGMNTQTYDTTPTAFFETGETAATTYDEYVTSAAIHVEGDNGNGFPAIFAELQENGITVSLANIEMAKKMQSYARLREKFTGLSDDEADEYIIDMLMSGIRIPDRALTQPILLGQQMHTFSQAKRYASDSGNLDDSVVSGYAGGSMNIRVPELDTGGVVMVIVECFPRQLYERQADPLFNIYDSVQQAVADGKPQTFCLPEAMRDALDPEKVDVIVNGQIDTSHTTDSSVFGYAPKNWKYNSAGPRLGGKFHADIATAADRQRFWAAETVDPVLGDDFYLVPDDLQTDIFVRSGDPFELFASGGAAMTGLTQFGGLLIEQTGNYEKIDSQMDKDRIDQGE